MRNNIRSKASLARLLAKLAADTAIDEIAFASWLRQNKVALCEGFYLSREPSEFREVENCAGIWLRQQFRALQVTA